MSRPRSCGASSIDFREVRRRGAGYRSSASWRHTEASPTAAEDVAAFLNGILRRHDLLVRTESCTWLLIRASSEDELERFFERASQAITDADRNRLGRPLPLVTMHTEGSWSGDDRLDELLAQILNESQPVGPRPD